MGFSLKSVRFIFAVNNLFTISFCTFSHWINGYFSRFFGYFKPFLGFSRLFYILYSACQITPSPSESDISSTRRIDSVLESLDITLIDHIITGIGGAVSMRELNLLSGSASPGYSY